MLVKNGGLRRPSFFAFGILLGLLTLAGCIQEFDRAQGIEGAAGPNSTTVANPTTTILPTPSEMHTPAPDPTDTPVRPTSTPDPTPEPTEAPTPTSPPPTPTPVPTPITKPNATPVNNNIPSLNLRVLGPAEGTRATSNAVVVHGTTAPGASVQVNGRGAQVDSNGSFRAEVGLFPGFNFISVVASDQAGNRQSVVITVVLPPQPFVLEVTGPKDQSVVSQRLVRVSGRTGSEATATVAGRPVAVDQLGAFSSNVALELGPNVIEIVANSKDGQKLTEFIAVIYRR